MQTINYIETESTYKIIDADYSMENYIPFQIKGNINFSSFSNSAADYFPHNLFQKPAGSTY